MHTSAPSIFRLLLVCCLLSPVCHAEDYTQYVDPHIGSGGHGHVFVGANVPFGAVQLGPSNFFRGWDWCSAYHYSDDTVVGFSHAHLSGTGIPDLGDLLVMPYTGEFTHLPGSPDDSDSGFASRYSHERETVRPGYYRVHLADYGVDVELSTTERVGVHRYQFPEGRQAHIAIDLQFENGGGHATDTTIEQRDARTIVGKRFSTGWARDQRLFYAIKSSVDLGTIRVFEGEKEFDASKGNGVAIRGFASFDQSPGEVLLKVGVSPVSIENALQNIEAEVPHWDFGKVAAEAKEKWNKELQVIDIATKDESHRRVFYTALYHTMIAPVLFNDHNGDYRGTDKEVYPAAPFANYSIFSLWDTYRAAHPLYTLTQPERVPEFVQSMLAIFDEQGKLPVWHLMGNETDTMIGYHAVPVIVDAYLKGFTGFDAERAYEAVKASAMRDERGLDKLKKLGFIPAESENESVAKAMEYAIDDWCIAQMAKSLGKDDDFQYFSKRAKYYQNYFDSDLEFMRGKVADGSWRTPFDPVKSKHRQDDYCEGNGWQYIWLVPQDPEGLIQLFGSDAAFIKKLDALFTTEFVRDNETSVDITGLIGQYAHGNEPGHHTTYLYAYAGQQWKTAEKIRHITTKLYHDDPDGLSGNEDCGQMSAWFVLSSLGFYPVNPAAGIYVFGSPLFDEAEIRLPGDKSFRVVAQEQRSRESLYPVGRTERKAT